MIKGLMSCSEEIRPSEKTLNCSISEIPKARLAGAPNRAKNPLSGLGNCSQTGQSLLL